MTDPATLRAELDQALGELEHLRLLVAERKVPADALHVASTGSPGSAAASPTWQPTTHPPGGRGSHRDAA